MYLTLKVKLGNEGTIYSVISVFGVSEVRSWVALEYLGPACQHLGYDDVSLSLDNIEKELVEVHMGQRQTSKDHHKIISEFLEQRAVPWLIEVDF